MLGHMLAGRYLLEERIADGGMGAVWRARDEVLQRPVAVKLLHSTFSGDPLAGERFRREALTAASISHPNMANVFDYVEEDGHPGIVMELIEGETVADLLAREKKIPANRAVAIIDDVLAALAAAHAAGVVHRDIKPSNILLTPSGMVKVADFGIAQVAGSAALTAVGDVIGSVRYMSPEQVRGQTATPAADLYATAAVLYQMLSGRVPFEGDSSTAIALARLNADPPPLDALVPSLPAVLSVAVMRGLARDPSDRHADAASMRAALAGGETSASATQLFGAEDETVAFTADPALQEGNERKPIPERARRFLTGVFAPLLIIGIVAMLIAMMSAAPSSVKTPKFTGRSIAEARALAATADLKIRVESKASSRPKGTILEQSPAAGVTVQADSTITLLSSGGPPPCCRMPEAVGLSGSAARARLADAGLKNVRTITVITTQGGSGQVIAQSPSSGDRVAPGDEVTITVASAPVRSDNDKDRGKGKGSD